MRMCGNHRCGYRTCAFTTYTFTVDGVWVVQHLLLNHITKYKESYVSMAMTRDLYKPMSLLHFLLRHTSRQSFSTNLCGDVFVHVILIKENGTNYKKLTTLILDQTSDCLHLEWPVVRGVNKYKCVTFSSNNKKYRESGKPCCYVVFVMTHMGQDCWDTLYL